MLCKIVILFPKRQLSSSNPLNWEALCTIYYSDDGLETGLNYEVIIWSLN